jgi:small subunit ribosomal protein S9
MGDSKIIFWGVGKRKTAIARVRLIAGKGKFIVNGKPMETFFRGYDRLISRILAPLKLVNMLDSYSVYANVNGGGKTGQADAIRHGISRALLKVDSAAFRAILKKEGMITRDSRIVERKKPGRPKARKRFQYSKR